MSWRQEILIASMHSHHATHTARLLLYTCAVMVDHKYRSCATERSPDMQCGRTICISQTHFTLKMQENALSRKKAEGDRQDLARAVCMYACAVRELSARGIHTRPLCHSPFFPREVGIKLLYACRTTLVPRADQQPCCRSSARLLHTAVAGLRNMFVLYRPLVTYTSHGSRTHGHRHIVRCQYEIEKAPSQPPPPPPPPPPRENFNMVCAHSCAKLLAKKPRLACSTSAHVLSQSILMHFVKVEQIWQMAYAVSYAVDTRLATLPSSCRIVFSDFD